LRKILIDLCLYCLRLLDYDLVIENQKSLKKISDLELKLFLIKNNAVKIIAKVEKRLETSEESSVVVKNHGSSIVGSQPPAN
jgi:hypothetical protein